MGTHRIKLANMLALYPLALLGLCAIHLFAPQRNGLLAISQIIAPYLFLPLLLLVPWLWQRHASLLRWAMLACALVFCVRFGPALVSLPVRAAPNAQLLRVVNWNVLYSNREPLADALLQADADVIALQECMRPCAAAVQASAALQQRFPYAVGRERGGELLILSAYPVLDRDVDKDPSTMWARLDLGAERTIIVFNVHLNSGTYRAAGLIPTAYDASERDEQIRRVRSRIDPLLEQREPLLMVGDFNTTDNEVSYTELARGLTDAHRAVGWGTGYSWHWKPTWPVGIIRIDYQWGSPLLTPLRLRTDCTLRGSDHCMLVGDWQMQ